MPRFALSLAGLVLLSLAQGAVAADQDWVAQSNVYALKALRAAAEFSPEGIAQLGVDGYDAAVTDLRPGVYERSQASQREVLAMLQAARSEVSDRRVQQDLDIMLAATEDNLHSQTLDHKLMLPFYQPARIAFQGIHALLDPRIADARKPAAVTRIKRYAGLEPGYEALTAEARARSEERFEVAGLTGPYRGEVEQYLSDSPRIVAGIRSEFEASQLTGWQDAMTAFEQQINAYDAWVREAILPRARADNRLPPEIYADNLRQVGVDIEPEVLIDRALTAFAEIRNEMQALAPLVAKEKKLKSSDYRDVIRALKKDQITGEAILPLYKQRLAKVEALIREHHIVTLPKREAVIRLASEAETAIIPAPHMSPPRLIGNTGEYGEFVLPLNVPARAGEAALKTDDFTFDAATWTLIAHEARPGHELQFAKMIENGVSIARGVFAFNSVNVEGWALYAEAETKPYLPLDGQLIGLQHRLMRAARAFLDPMVNLGQLTPEQADRVLREEVVLSEAMAKQEVDRYTYNAPGQATSYFYGYQNLMQTRQRAQLALREKFDRQAFNDFVIAQGLLPPAILRRAVLEQFVPAS